jgi:hypothetical protein
MEELPPAPPVVPEAAAPAAPTVTVMVLPGVNPDSHFTDVPPEPPPPPLLVEVAPPPAPPAAEIVALTAVTPAGIVKVPLEVKDWNVGVRVVPITTLFDASTCTAHTSALLAAFLDSTAHSLFAVRKTPVDAGLALVLMNGAVAVADRQLPPVLFLQVIFPVPESP